MSARYTFDEIREFFRQNTAERMSEARLMRLFEQAKTLPASHFDIPYVNIEIFGAGTVFADAMR